MNTRLSHHRRALYCALVSLLLTLSGLALTRMAVHGGSETARRAAIYAIPVEGGRDLTVAAGRLGELTMPVFAHIGGTSEERSHTLSYSPSNGEYSYTFGGVMAAAQIESGFIQITTTVTPTLGYATFIRHYVPGSSAVDLPSQDGVVNLHISAHGVPTDTYLVIMSTQIPPGDPPAGHRLVGQPYSIRASGSFPQSLKPMVLRIGYEASWLNGVDPHSVGLFSWNPGQGAWLDLSGNPSSAAGQRTLSAAVQTYTTYALMSAPYWRDTFPDTNGLAERNGVRLAPGGKLELASGASSGWAISTPITPTGSFAGWRQLAYRGLVPANTSLAVSLLDGRTRAVLLSNLADGADLSVVDPHAHPSVRLRLDLSRAAAGSTPSLEEWTVSWRPAPASQKLYLPLLLADLPAAAGKASGTTKPPEQPAVQPALATLPASRPAASAALDFGCTPPSPPPITWSPPANLSDNASFSLTPALAVDPAGLAHAVWYDNSAGNFDVYYASRSVDGAWSAPVNISNTPGNSYWPAIAADGLGNVHVAWEDGSTGRDILYMAKLAGSAAWAPPVNIANSPGTSRYVALTADSEGNVHAVWQDDTPGNTDIYYATRAASSGAWSPPAVVAATPMNSWGPTVAVDPDRGVHVAWHDFTPGVTEIYYAYKPSAAAAWSSPVNASRTTGASYYPALAVDSTGVVHLVWMDAITVGAGGSFKVLYAQKPSGGDWTPYTDLSRDTDSAEMPTLAIGAADAVHVAWDTTSEPRDLLYVRRPAPGMGWTTPVAVTSISAGAQNPVPSLAAATDENAVHLVWSDFGALSQDILTSWTAPPPIPADHVLVLDEHGWAVAGACVYRNGQATVATDELGVFVPPALAVGDTLVALQPLAQQATVRQHHTTDDNGGVNWAFRTYVTNLDITGDGTVQPFVVSQLGQQRLVVRRDQPLILFNLVVSIEWDATVAYTEQVSQAVRLASDYLYDVSDGQMALGRVTIADNGDFWEDADVQISLHNRMVPHAYVGGIVAQDRAQVIRVGRHWDGDSGAQGAWDLPNGFRTLIHEFGHYALHLYDEYRGYTYDDDGAISGEQNTFCTDEEPWSGGSPSPLASIMEYQYTRSELADQGLPDVLWSDWCELTAQWQLNNHESDWETVTRHYTDTVSPPRWSIVSPGRRGAVMAGPAAFPAAALPFLAIELHNSGPDSPARRLTVLGIDGRPYRNGATVSLDTRRGPSQITLSEGLIDATEVITLYGAAPGNIVRVLSLDAAQRGEFTIGQALAYTLTLRMNSNQRAPSSLLAPHVMINPEPDGQTLTVVVDGVDDGAVLYALVATPGSAAPVRAPLSANPAGGGYAGHAVFTTLRPGIGGLYVRGIGPLGEPVALDSDFALLTVDTSADNDLYTADGNAWLHLDAHSFATPSTMAVLMPTGAVPQPLPAGYAATGNAYAVRFSGSSTGPARPGVLSLFYPPDRIAGAAGLSIHRWNPTTNAWESLGGQVDAVHNAVSVRFDRVGIYALLAAETPAASKIYLPVILR